MSLSSRARQVENLKFLDTNILIELQDRLSDICPFTISSVSLNELEDIKTNRHKSDELHYAARKAIHWLDEHEDKYSVVVYGAEQQDKLAKMRLVENGDNMILSCCSDEYTFVTNDLCCKVIARDTFKYTVESRKDIDEIYRGYISVIGNSELINEWMENHPPLITNEYIIITNTDDDSTREMRWDGDKFVALKLPPSKIIKAKNSLQRCALDIMMNPDITIAAILGGYGSGKTYLSMRMALYCVNDRGWQSKMLGVREVRGEGEEIGFLPGEKQAKIGDFFLPLIQQLDGGEFEYDALKQRGVFEANTPYFMKGTTYNNTIILVDEAEDLTYKQLRLIGTRLGDNSRIFLDGDYKQSLIDTSESNPLLHMCNKFMGNPKFACIYLGEDVRSETSKLFAELLA